MTSRQPDNDELFSRYTDQPMRLPQNLRADIERATGGRPVQLYALTDLDASMQLKPTWVALGPDHVALAPGANGAAPPGDIQLIERSRLEKVQEAPCPSCTVLTLLGAHDAHRVE